MPRQITESHTAPCTPPLQDTTTPDTNSSSDITSHHIETLQQLDKQHYHLKQLESALENYLQQLKHEEDVLRLALDQSSTSLREQRERERSRREEEAVRRLEDVLMGGSSSEEDNDNAGDNVVTVGERTTRDFEDNWDRDDDWGDGEIVNI